ncbi:hypothetical protein BBJ28_00001700 [Nothophytophthora sp. Chile5]|nr:hypothetical protein BBJ28_00001700 [Nothophytophthora sp. Chile5]
MLETVLESMLMASGSGSADEELGVGAAFLKLFVCCNRATVRSIFLTMVGLDWCDVLSGKVSTSACSTGQRDLFYILDQVPILAFFAVYALLVQFWAEVYYNAVDKLSTLTNVVKPTIRWLIVVRWRALIRTYYPSAGIKR